MTIDEWVKEANKASDDWEVNEALHTALKIIELLKREVVDYHFSDASKVNIEDL